MLLIAASMTAYLLLAGTYLHEEGNDYAEVRTQRQSTSLSPLLFVTRPEVYLLVFARKGAEDVIVRNNCTDSTRTVHSNIREKAESENGASFILPSVPNEE